MFLEKGHIIFTFYQFKIVKGSRYFQIDLQNKYFIALVFLIVDESPAFVCEKVSVELEVDRMTDMAVDDMIKTKNVLYISRGQLKNHTSTVLNFNIGKTIPIVEKR